MEGLRARQLQPLSSKWRVPLEEEVHLAARRDALVQALVIQQLHLLESTPLRLVQLPAKIHPRRHQVKAHLRHHPEGQVLKVQVEPLLA